MRNWFSPCPFCCCLQHTRTRPSLFAQLVQPSDCAHQLAVALYVSLLQLFIGLVYYPRFDAHTLPPLLRICSDLSILGQGADAYARMCARLCGTVRLPTALPAFVGPREAVLTNGTITRMEFWHFSGPLKGREHRGRSGEYYSVDDYHLRDGLRAAVGEKYGML
jgi:hypothetical protein